MRLIVVTVFEAKRNVALKLVRVALVDAGIFHSGMENSKISIRRNFYVSVIPDTSPISGPVNLLLVEILARTFNFDAGTLIECGHSTDA